MIWFKIMKNLTAILAAFFLLFGFWGTADAQTKKKKKRTKKTTTTQTKPVPQPVLVPQTLPVIVSQADQYQDQNQPVVTETPTENQTETQPETYEERIEKLNARIMSLESSKNGNDDRQKRLLMNLDILTRAEQRAESLRKQLYELTEKENTFRLKLETIDYELRPEMIERQVAMTGSLRPEELREMKKKNLEAEKRSLTNMLTGIQNTKTNLEATVLKADQMVEKLRAVLEKEIDDALTEKPKDQ